MFPSNERCIAIKRALHSYQNAYQTALKAQSQSNDTHHRGWFRIYSNQKRPTCSSKEPNTPTKTLVEHATAQSKGNGTHHRGWVHIYIHQKRPTCPSKEPTIPTQMLVEHATAQSQSNDTHHRGWFIYISIKRDLHSYQKSHIYSSPRGVFVSFPSKKSKKYHTSLRVNAHACASFKILYISIQNPLYYREKSPRSHPQQHTSK